MVLKWGGVSFKVASQWRFLHMSPLALIKKYRISLCVVRKRKQKILIWVLYKSTNLESFLRDTKHTQLEQWSPCATAGGCESEGDTSAILLSRAWSRCGLHLFLRIFTILLGFKVTETQKCKKIIFLFNIFLLLFIWSFVWDFINIVVYL